MTIKLFSAYKCILRISFAALLIGACSPADKKNSTQNKYLLIINGEKGSRDEDRMLWFDALDSNLILHTDQASSINNKLGSAVIPTDSFLLSFDKKAGSLSKYLYAADGLKPVAELKLQDFEYISFTTRLDSSLLYISGRGENNISSYAIVNTKEMELAKKGQLNLPVAKGQNASDNFGILKEHQFYIGYSSFGEDYDHCSDTSYLAVLDYPGLKLKTVDKDTRSAFPGAGVNGLFNYFTDAKDDLYVLTSPVFYHGNHPTAPTAFYRLSSGKGTFDKDYFFNLSAQLKGDHLLGITQAAAGKVILATISFPSTGKSDYYLADVQAKTLKLLLKNQNQPNFIWGTSGFYDGKNASFIVNEAEGKARMYVYDSDKDILRKGPTLAGKISRKSSYLILKPSKHLSQ